MIAPATTINRSGDPAKPLRAQHGRAPRTLIRPPGRPSTSSSRPGVGLAEPEHRLAAALVDAERDEGQVRAEMNTVDHQCREPQITDSTIQRIAATTPSPERTTSSCSPSRTVAAESDRGQDL